MQDAFKEYKLDMIRRSERRQIEIESRNEERKRQAEIQKLKFEIDMKFRHTQQQKTKDENEPGYFIMTNQKNKRVMSTKEIKDLTRKNYEKLTEVKDKLRNEKIEKAKKLNKLKYSMYTKIIQKHVLTHGPNFAMEFKAIQH